MREGKTQLLNLTPAEWVVLKRWGERHSRFNKLQGIHAGTFLTFPLGRRSARLHVCGESNYSRALEFRPGHPKAQTGPVRPEFQPEDPFPSAAAGSQAED